MTYDSILSILTLVHAEWITDASLQALRLLNVYIPLFTFHLPQPSILPGKFSTIPISMELIRLIFHIDSALPIILHKWEFNFVWWIWISNACNDKEIVRLRGLKLEHAFYSIVHKSFTNPLKFNSFSKHRLWTFRIQIYCRIEWNHFTPHWSNWMQQINIMIFYYLLFVWA